MNKSDLVETISEMNEMPKTTVKEVLDATLDTITDALVEKEKVDLFGFGSFSTSERAARKGRNPATGESIDIGPSTQIKFKPSKAFKDAVKG